MTMTSEFRRRFVKPDSERSVIVYVDMDKKQVREADEIAQRLGLSRAELLRFVVQAYVNEKNNRPAWSVV